MQWEPLKVNTVTGLLTVPMPMPMPMVMQYVDNFPTADITWKQRPI